MRRILENAVIIALGVAAVAAVQALILYGTVERQPRHFADVQGPPGLMVNAPRLTKENLPAFKTALDEAKSRQQDFFQFEGKVIPTSAGELLVEETHP